MKSELIDDDDEEAVTSLRQLMDDRQVSGVDVFLIHQPLDRYNCCNNIRCTFYLLQFIADIKVDNTDLKPTRLQFDDRKKKEGSRVKSAKYPRIDSSPSSSDEDESMSTSIGHLSSDGITETGGITDTQLNIAVNFALFC